MVTKFDKQLRVLNDELESSELHFIRCIKPNELKEPDHIDDRFVLQQIKYLGILETIQIRKSAFPFRTSFQHFVDNYRELTPFDKTFNKLSAPEQCMSILKKMFPGIEKGKNCYMLGKERVYLKEEMEAKLNQLALENFQHKSKAVSKIQKQFLRHKQRGKLVKGLKKYLARMKMLKIIFAARLARMKSRYLKKFKEQAKLATAAVKKRKEL